MNNGGAKLLKRLDDTSSGVIKPSKALLADRAKKVKIVEKEVKVRLDEVGPEY